jgi:hypothetical protein
MILDYSWFSGFSSFRCDATIGSLDFLSSIRKATVLPRRRYFEEIANTHRLGCGAVFSLNPDNDALI